MGCEHITPIIFINFILSPLGRFAHVEVEHTNFYLKAPVAYNSTLSKMNLKNVSNAFFVSILAYSRR